MGCRVWYCLLSYSIFIQLFNYIESVDFKQQNLILLKNIVKEKQQISTLSNRTIDKNRKLFFLNDDEIESSSQNNNNQNQNINQQQQQQYTSILNTEIVENFKVWHLLFIFLLLWIVIGMKILVLK